MTNDLAQVLPQIDDLRAQYRYHDAWQLWSQHPRLNALEQEQDVSWVLAGGDVGRMVGQWEAAAQCYQQALEYAADNDDDQLLADCAAALASVRRAQSQFGEALLLYDEAEAIYEAYEDAAGLAFVAWGRGGVYRFSGDLEEALAQFEFGYKLANDQGLDEAAAYCLCGIGGSCRASGAYDKSLHYYGLASEKMQELGDLFGLAYSHCGVGNATRMLGGSDEAQSHFLKAVDGYQRIGDMVSYAYTLWSLGTLYKCQKQWAKAAEIAQQACEAFAQANDQRGQLYGALLAAEIDWLANHNNSALEQIDALVRQAIEQGLLLEAAYGHLILGIAKNDQGHRTDAQSLLAQCGSSFWTDTLPANFP